MRRRPTDHLLKRVSDLEEAVRKLRQPVFGASGASGPAALSWFALSDIWTPAAGVAANPFGYQPSCRFAVDQDFFYISAKILLGGAFTVGTLDESSKPTYVLGGIANVAAEPWLPPGLPEDQTWGFPTSVDPVYADQGTAAGISLTLPVLSGGPGTFAVIFDTAGASAVGSALEFHAALPWMPGSF